MDFFTEVDSKNIETDEHSELNSHSEVDLRNDFGDEVEARENTLSSQEIAVNAHIETKEEMLREHGECMQAEQINRLSDRETEGRIKVMSSEEYVNEYPNSPLSVIGHCDNEGNIVMKDISPSHVEHTSTHETMHQCSYREAGGNFYSSSMRVGLRETTSFDGGQEITHNRGINEGTTEMYTMRELNRRGETEAAGIGPCYKESQMCAKRMEYLVGKDTLEKAYFGGDHIHLKVAFNELNDNDIEAWDNFSRDVDIVEYSNDQMEVDAAQKRLTDRFANMYINKMINGER